MTVLPSAADLALGALFDTSPLNSPVTACGLSPEATAFALP